MKLLVTRVPAALFILVIAGMFLDSRSGAMPGDPAQSGRSDWPVDTTPGSTPTSCLGTWSVVPSPNTATGQDLLHGVARVSANDVWAVGSSGPFTGSLTLREHWDGNAWSVVPGPDAGIISSLGSVAALSTTDVWAVGYYYDSTGYQPLIEHWDGALWSIVPSGALGIGGSLSAVAALSANDLWAVGSRASSNNVYVNETLVEHWDGTSWSVISSPNVGTNSNYLSAIAPVSTNDVWTVGSHTSSSNIYLIESLVEHWDGTSWSVVPSPNVGTGWNFLHGIAGASANDLWAIGRHEPEGGQTTHILIEHWDGTSWSVVPSPEPAPFGRNLLQGLIALSTDDVWAVGFYNVSGYNLTLVEHWDGTSWSVVPSPNVGTDSSNLNGVAGVSPNDIWAVGSSYDNGQVQTLAEHYISQCASPTAVPTSTPTYTPAETPANTPAALLVGHVRWQGPPPQPSTGQQLPVTLTLRPGSNPDINYTGLTTDSTGFFTVTVTGLTEGSYNWRAKGPKYLASCGTVTLSGAPLTQQEMGTLRAGDTDATHDNMVDSLDFMALRSVFGAFSPTGDLNNDGLTNTFDFNQLRGNFGTAGCSPILGP